MWNISMWAGWEGGGVRVSSGKYHDCLHNIFKMSDDCYFANISHTVLLYKWWSVWVIVCDGVVAKLGCYGCVCVWSSLRGWLPRRHHHRCNCIWSLPPEWTTGVNFLAGLWHRCCPVALLKGFCRCLLRPAVCWQGFQGQKVRTQPWRRVVFCQMPEVHFEYCWC